ncbi:MAG: hypothetical protein ACD_28C00171G0001 [uncultured bacterium]|nr:MAG: hypothetical protein ACD_28C00171G0001 [uncultured bacterium]KKT74063.1 MAG: hypothetical protein UW70_C0068G0016 [Candidatus Peregrinibacteria bacterium GW2011_GWA2_44_7]
MPTLTPTIRIKEKFELSLDLEGATQDQIHSILELCHRKAGRVQLNESGNQLTVNLNSEKECHQLIAQIEKETGVDLRE